MESLKEFGSMGLSRLARVQDSHEKTARSLKGLALSNRITAAQARADGVPYGTRLFVLHGILNAQSLLAKQRRAQLAKFGHKLNQSELRYAKYGDADGLHAAVAARRGLNLEANLKPALREFAGGYVNTDAGVVKDRGVGSHLQRNAGAYLGTAMFPVVGTGVGAVIDYLRKRPNIVKTKDESPVSARTAAALGHALIFHRRGKP